MGKDSRYWAGRYAGKVSIQGTGPGLWATQYQNKPQPSRPPTTAASLSTDDAQKAGLGICDAPHCEVCKKPVANEPHGGFCGDPACSICEAFMKSRGSVRNKASLKSKKEVKMDEDEPKDFEYQQLYEVTTTYGVDRDKVVVKRTDVVAENDKRALMQSKDDIDPEWDMDYVEQHVNMLCAVRVKRKPREILKG